ncbi:MULTISPECIES: flavodoxin family protein BilS [unclassified Clostridioides]|uniref:flavodoxin family protein BilS n=1 Tax=unclassified Clostridioides TaxID=2635829 RepID=UPI001D0CC01C|nr:flavodoxin [Clostridioides sp. ES-S-0001-02]MCC0655779.1 flavodoxin [Clostridioides sp. ES-S-0123-01]MCC0673962.1 flavodoxin [Clostridioides sp. ES-S-0145-01]MCC0680566.1 flavodoxin [Clostridioides sp. ES-S-0005-03]MCC0694838.1 flavodoxin [Clostridioides sp. ES-S-0048-02]MCC0703025.1 flavodoxin [Clostridioides sp. ES-S-0049-02]MCC0763359.1 flavodoxin [Clostridioides sp. ES-S-0006-03]UDN46784.1 flavodoxin [Clostridioides sp. ES-S-0173-01]UDN59243.1 flavodoxin [Clostridioides sp. ES-S-0010
MKSLILYSSLTGNTKKIAQSIYDAMQGEKEIKNISEVTDNNVDYEKYDIIFLGYWVDKGICDKNSKLVFENIHNKKLALFGTMGANTKGNYGINIMDKVKDVFSKDNEIVGSFICQGKIAEGLKVKYEEMLKLHPENEHIREQLKGHEESQSHPDEQDVSEAVRFTKDIMAKVSDM